MSLSVCLNKVDGLLGGAGYAVESGPDAVGEPADGLSGVVVAGHRASFSRAASSSSLQILTAARLSDDALAHRLTFALSTRRTTRPPIRRSVNLAPLLGMTPSEFRGDLQRQKTRVALWRCLRDPAFSRFGTVLTCDRQTDRRTDRQTERQTDTRRQHIPCQHSVAR